MNKQGCCKQHHSCTHEEYNRIKTARRNLWRKNNKELNREQVVRWAKEHPDRIREHRRRWTAKNKKNHARYMKPREAEARRTLSDRYIALALRVSSFTRYIPASKIPRALIEAKRAQLMLYRLAKETT